MDQNPYIKNFLFLSSKIRRRFFVAFLLVGIVGLLEMFSLSALLAFFGMGFNTTGGRVQAWIQELGFTPSASFLLMVTLCVFVLKSIIVLVVGRYSYRTAIAARKGFQDMLFERFLQYSFKERSERKSADWVRSITTDCNALEGRFFTPVLVLVGEIIPALCICGMLLLVNSTIFLVALGVFVALGALVFLSTHNRLVDLGKVQQAAESKIVQAVQQAFHGLCELKIYALHGWAKRTFEGHTDTSSTAVSEALSISLLPRFVFEVAIYISLGVILAVYAFQDVPLMKVVGEVAVFGVAAMRLLPSVSKVVSHLQSFKYAKSTIETVNKELSGAVSFSSLSSVDNFNKITFNTLSLSDITFYYGDKTIFRNLSLEIFSGDAIAIVGSSGTGKSTLINLALGLIEPHQGNVTLNGHPLVGIKSDWWSCVAYVPQEPFLIEGSALSNLFLGKARLSDADVKIAEELLVKLGLHGVAKDMEASVGEDGGRLSGGQRQRLAIARALLRDPQVLILDEATSAMDVQTQDLVMSVVSEYMEGRVLLMITHRAETLKFCKRVLALSEGRLVTQTAGHD